MDIPDDFWTSFGGCVNGDRRGEGVGKGVSLTLDGNFLLTASFYDVTLYEYDPSGWQQIKRFRAELELVDNGKGFYKAEISRLGNYIIVGSPNNGNQGIDTGAVQAFKLEDGEWSQFGNILYGDAAGDLFGQAVQIADLNMRLVVGASGGNYARAYTYKKPLWSYTQDQDMGGGDSLVGTDFGFAAGLSSDAGNVIIGAPNFLNRRGMIRAYNLDGHENTQQITGDNVSGLWGFAVAMTADGQTVAVSSPGLGRVRVYRSDPIRNVWEQAGFDMVIPGEEFGFALAIIGTGRSIGVGAPGNAFNGINAGAGYIFDYDAEWPDLTGKWVQRGLPFYAVEAGSRCGEDMAFSEDGLKVVTGCPSADFDEIDGGRLCVYIPQEFAPSSVPTTVPSFMPAMSPNGSPTNHPTALPTKRPIKTNTPTKFPTAFPTKEVDETSPGLPGDGDEKPPYENPTVIIQIILALISMLLTFFGGIFTGGYCGYGCYGCWYEHGCCYGHGYYLDHWYDWWQEPWHQQQQQQM